MGEPAISTLSARAADRGAVRAAVADAARATGANFDYLLAQAKLESNFDPQARARSSSATGLYQFIRSTWAGTLRDHGARLGYGEAAAMATDPARQNEVMALRTDPRASALMAGALAQDNRAALMPVLGREPDAAELYLAHFLGAPGATRFLSTLRSDPDASAAALMPGSARANRAIFYSADGDARSVDAVMGLVRTKVARAMEHNGAGEPGIAAPSTHRSPYAFHNGALPASAPAPHRSMAETVREAFGASDRATPPHVAAAYDRLRMAGL